MDVEGVPGVMHIGETTIVSNDENELVAEIDMEFEPLIDMEED